MNTKIKLTGIILIILVFSTLIFSSCSNSAAECSDDAVTGLVKQIASEQFTKAYGLKLENQELFIDAIRTTDINEKTGCHSCAAQIWRKRTNGTKTKPVGFTYTSEKTDNEDQIYVTVYGINAIDLF